MGGGDGEACRDEDDCDDAEPDLLDDPDDDDELELSDDLARDFRSDPENK